MNDIILLSGLDPTNLVDGWASKMRAMTADEGLGWGFFNSLHASDAVFDAAWAMARQIADGPTFAHAMTKKLLHQEWALGVDEAIEAEAQAQAICMRTGDFRRAYDAFVAKRKPVFEGDGMNKRDWLDRHFFEERTRAQIGRAAGRERVGQAR